jgi:hypothetical protein
MTRAADDGRFLVNGSPGYDKARTVWNAMVDRRPGVSVRCANADDVVDAIRYGRECELEIGVRCGGHTTRRLTSLPYLGSPAAPQEAAQEAKAPAQAANSDQRTPAALWAVLHPACPPGTQAHDG